jgi:hypothetical protein
MDERQDLAAPFNIGEQGNPRHTVMDLCSFQNLVFERDAFRVVLLKPCLSSVRIGEYLNVVLVADLFARIDVKQRRSLVPHELPPPP